MVRTKWEIDISHKGLNKYRHISGTDQYVVEQKAEKQLKTWEAEEKSVQAQKVLATIENTLNHALCIDSTIEWESLLDTTDYPVAKPPYPTSANLRPPPLPTIGFIASLIPIYKRKKLEEREAEKQVAEIKREVQHKETIQKWEADIKKWKKEKEDYFKKQHIRNQPLLKKKEAYFKKDNNVLIKYCKMVLSNSEYPESFPRKYSIDYNQTNKIIVVDFALPSLDDVPNLKEVKYIISKDEIKEVFLSATAFNKMYDNLIYQITLRTIHELFVADAIKAIGSIIFNGWVNSRDKATGKEVNACILTVQTSREEFLSINLEHVDSKACFKILKGVGSSKLHSLSPVAPIMKIDREDTRFVCSYDVADDIDDSVNLAAMDWQDFENLVRELFEKEFTQYGGEVKITQASRDGGVDAIAFDPDPIRGGKIVIQAKRYTNVVGVSAVRDLYGTIVNEGANKGILVTTADYGPDAYNFAKGKPITLLSGGNLLHLLEKHGHRARIDLKEAKKILAEQNS